MNSQNNNNGIKIFAEESKKKDILIKDSIPSFQSIGCCGKKKSNKF